jgi:hypothetical protein
MNLLLRILFDEWGGILAITRKTANTLITAAGFNTNYGEIEAVVNGDIDATNIEDAAITAAKLGTSAVETSKILDANVTAAKLASDAVETAKIKDANVTAAKLASDAVETAKIKDAAVTTAKIADTYLTNTLHDTTTRHGSSVVDHGSIGGLTDNDHPQYARGQSTNYKIDSGGPTTISATTQAVSFNFTFAVAPVVVIGWANSVGSDSDWIVVTSITTTGFTAYTRNVGLGSKSFTWIAIGSAAA